MRSPKANYLFPVKSIKIIWTESGAFEDGTTFNRIDDFDSALTTIARAKDNIGGYDKTQFKVVFEATDSNGEPFEYIGRIDVHHIDDQQETTTGELSLIQHMADYFGYMIGINKPAHKTQEDYENDLKVYGNNPKYIEWAVFLGIIDPPNTHEDTLADKVAILLDENRNLKAKLERLENLVNVIADEIANSTVE